MAAEISLEDSEALQAWAQELEAESPERAALLLRVLAAQAVRRFATLGPHAVGRTHTAGTADTPYTETSFKLPDRSLHSDEYTFNSNNNTSKRCLLSKVAKEVQACENSPPESPVKVFSRSAWALSDLSSLSSHSEEVQRALGWCCLRAAATGAGVAESPHGHDEHGGVDRGASGASATRSRRRFEFTADPPVFSVQHGSLVKTSFGSYLKRKGLMKFVTLALAAVAGVVTMLQPLHADVPEDGPLYRQIDDGSARILELRVVRSGLFTWLTKEITCVMLWFLMLHHVNQEIFLASLWTFDFLMIMGSMVVAEFFRFYNMFDYWASLGYYDSTWIAFDFVDLFLVVLPTGLFISTMDSWHLAAWVNGARCNSIKIILSAIAVAYFTKSYLDTFFGHGSLRWAEREACVFGMCTNPRQAFASAELQKVLFMSKAMSKYAMGWPFASNVPRFTMRDSFPEPAFARLVNAVSEALSSKASAMAGGRWSTATAPEVQPKEPAKDELPGHTGA